MIELAENKSDRRHNASRAGHGWHRGKRYRSLRTRCIPLRYRNFVGRTNRFGNDYLSLNQLRLATHEELPAAPVGIARFGELFGEADRKVFRVVPRTVMGLLSEEPCASAEGSIRDFVYVQDAARAIRDGEVLDFEHTIFIPVVE